MILPASDWLRLKKQQSPGVSYSVSIHRHHLLDGLYMTMENLTSVSGKSDRYRRSLTRINGLIRGLGGSGMIMISQQQPTSSLSNPTTSISNYKTYF